jgi:hypothetical protein
LCVGVQVDQLTQARSAPAARATPRGSGMCPHEQGSALVRPWAGRAERRPPCTNAGFNKMCATCMCATVRRPRVRCNKAVATCAALTIKNELKASLVCVRPLAPSLSLSTLVNPSQVTRRALAQNAVRGHKIKLLWSFQSIRLDNESATIRTDVALSKPVAFNPKSNTQRASLPHTAPPPNMTQLCKNKNPITHCQCMVHWGSLDTHVCMPSLAATHTNAT